MAGTRIEGKRWMLYSTGRSGCRVARMLTRDEGEALVQEGRAHRKYDDYSGEMIGYQLGLDKADQGGDYDIPSIATSTSISVVEVVVNAGAIFSGGKSRTAGMAEDRRIGCVQPEDRIERVQAKVRVYAQIGPARGDILRVWPRK